MTMHDGLVDQRVKFKKRVASSNTSQYKVATQNQLVVGFPIDEGVLSFQNLYNKAIVSPAYDIWDLIGTEEVDNRYLERFLRSPMALTFYASKLRGTTARRRTLPDDIFLSLSIPLPALSQQQRIAAILDKADELRAKRRAALAQVEFLSKARFMDLFGNATRNPKAIPKIALGEIIRLKSGEFLPAVRMAAEGTFPVFGGNGVNGYHDQFLFDEPQIVIGRVGVYCGSVHVSPPKSWITDNELYVSERTGDLEFAYLAYALNSQI